jgi:hypothetical protein
MSLQLVDISLDVLTTMGPLQYKTRFGPGLNVLAAPNSYGKSTLLQGIIFALGLEGMLTSSHAAPLGPIMTTVADLPGGNRPAVVESSVTLTCRNEAGKYLRTRRFARSNDVQLHLVQTWAADSEEGLETAERIDTFVRIKGAAVRELGFHRLLEEFLGWSLPKVPTFSAEESLLHLEALFPLFYVEQKSGWAGVTPRMPTYLGIRDMLRRSVEYVLGLSTLDRLRALNALKDELTEVRLRWTAAVERIESAAAAESLRAGVSRTVTGRTQRIATRIEADVDGAWTALDAALARWAARLAELEGARIATAGERTSRSQVELAEAEQAVRRLGGQLRTYTEQTSYVEADLDALRARLAAVEADRRRLQDVRRVRALGSDLGVPLLSDDLCPTCLQTLDDRHVATGEAASVEATLVLGDAERTTLMDMQSVAERRLADLSRARDAISQQLDHARGQVRLLRDELVTESAAPSLVEVREQLWLKERIAGAERVQAGVAAADEELDSLAERYDDLRARLRSLESEPMSEQDGHLLDAFNRRFREQLTLYGLRSLPPSQVTIDANTLIPTDEGVELRFDIGLGMSASDTIRTKWAYYVSLLETAIESPSGHHAGLLMLDEPHQQETAKVSLAALVRQLGVAATQGSQILYATSEDVEDLESDLEGIRHERLPAPGERLLSPAG